MEWLKKARIQLALFDGNSFQLMLTQLGNLPLTITQKLYEFLGAR